MSIADVRDWEDVAAGGTLIVEPVECGAWRLSEAAVAPAERSHFYLIEGSDADCLIDGGWGLCAGLAQLPRRAGKPLVAIATHSHFDHIGLLHLVPIRYAHAVEASILAHPDPVSTQALPYLDGLGALAGGASLDPVSIRQEACPPTGLLVDGATVDLGGRVIEVMHVPGHSPGSLALVDASAGLLFCADTVHDGYIWDDIPGADAAALLLSHQRLAEVEFRKACPGHGAILGRAAFRDRIFRYRREAGY